MARLQMESNVSIEADMSSFNLATMRSARWRAASLLSVAVGSLAACAAPSGYPSQWTALQAPADARGPDGRAPNATMCPDLRGEYRIDNQVIFANLIAQHLSENQRAAGWSGVRISGDTRTALVAELLNNVTQPRITVPLVVGRDFTCADGWALMMWPRFLIRGSSAQTGTNRAYDWALQITRDREGRLIGREVERSYVEFSVWCGDGCQSVPIPFTGRETTYWHRMSTEAIAERDAGSTPFTAAVNARAATEERALMDGAPGDSRADNVRRRVMRVEQRVLDPSR